MPNQATIVWFRRDLRIHDNPAWNHAISQGNPVIPIYIHAPNEEGRWPRGAASNWWLHHALEDLDQQLHKVGSKLVIRSSNSSLSTLQELCHDSGAKHICWNRCYDPAIVTRDTTIKKSLLKEDINVHSFMV
ncbi:MAG: deoxyribodipyrimidine photo-lyase, partial [Verrucomicrobiae bacterium]|nr:deoxyribodipyrimidine photo-lyase [Verrucomicrobiae bacterium]NNJ87671.1 deoxyribodipyrimidine photo-lyase [Akkermansiaceae bacterium]